MMVDKACLYKNQTMEKPKSTSEEQCLSKYGLWQRAQCLQALIFDVTLSRQHRVSEYTEDLDMQQAAN